VIIAQGAVTGDPLLASDLVLMRVCEWRLKDYAKYRRWQLALDKAFRIDQRRTAAPLNNPLLPEMKRVGAEQLRPVVTRMQERFFKERVLPTGKKLNEEIVDAFAEEACNPDLPFLNHPHNRELWIRFCRRNPVTYLHLSPEKLFDEFTGFVTMHDAEYVRQRISSLKK